MRSTRKRYHFAVKGLLRSQTDLRNACLAEASINKTPNVFWREVKRANAGPSSVQVSNVVNGQTDCHDIANKFKNAYSDIFRAGFATVDDLDMLRKELDDSCVNSMWEKFSVEELGAACKQLKPNKKDSDMSLYSYVFKYAPADLLIVLCDLINALILHGHAPLSWLSGTILPLLKSASLDKTQVLSYRPITLSSLFVKIIDIMVLNRYQNLFLTSNRQFGFKKDSSTNHCSFVLKEVISYYLRSNTDVFACALDI